jgi:hypothetical protein
MEASLTILFDKTKRFFSPRAIAKRTTHEQDLLNSVTYFFEISKNEITAESTPAELIRKILTHPKWPWVDQQMIQIVKLHELPPEYFPIIGKKEIQLVLWRNNRPYLFKLVAPRRTPTGVFYFLATCLLDFLNHHGYVITSTEKSQQRSLDLIDSLEEPFVMIEESGELIASNLLFSQMKLLPKECLALKDDAKIEKQGEVYIVKKNVCQISGGKYHILVFLGAQKIITESVSDEGQVSELGIITSSIAHELNNPIAGILASIQVLKLNHEFHQEFKVQLDEMERSGKRCKELVQIFLGFSKGGQLDDEHLSFYQCLEHATALLRSRMVENNVVMNASYEKNDQYICYPKKSAATVMALYLILNEIITALSKKTLLDWSDSIRSKNLSMSLKEQKSGITLNINPMPTGMDFTQPLLLHLLTLENYQLAIDTNGITFKQQF